MKKKWFLAVFSLVFAASFVFSVTAPVFAANECEGVSGDEGKACIDEISGCGSDESCKKAIECKYNNTSVIKVPCDEDGIMAILKIIMTILTFGVGAAAIAGLVFAGVKYSMAGGDSGKVTAAKKMIFDIVVGLLVYGVLWAALNWLLPGGL